MFKSWLSEFISSVKTNVKLLNVNLVAPVDGRASNSPLKQKTNKNQNKIKNKNIIYSAKIAGVCSEGAAFDPHANVTAVRSPEMLENVRPISNFSIRGISGSTNATHIGTLRGTCVTRTGTIVEFKLKNVVVIPTIENDVVMCAYDFIQLPKIKRFVLPSRDEGAYVELRNNEFIDIPIVNKLCFIDIRVQTSKKRKRGVIETMKLSLPNVFSSSHNKVTKNSAHAILCHPSEAKMDLIKKNNLIEGIDWNENDTVNNCFPCAIGKSHLSRKIANKEPSVALAKGDRIFTDIEGPIATPGFGGVLYAVHFTDSYSRFTVTYFMKQKSDVHLKLQDYIKEYCLPQGIIIKKIQADAENVYIGPNCRFRDICNEHKILLTSSSPYSHWENGVAERVIRTMMEKSFTVMAQRDIAAQHWAHALSHVVKVNNCLPHSSINNETPYWRWYESRPKFTNVKPFGCDVRVNTPKEDKPKKYIDPPGWMGIYIGFDYDSSSHKVFKPSHGAYKWKIVNCGDRQCKFFDLIDTNLYLKEYTDPAYVEYFKKNKSRKGPEPLGGEENEEEKLVTDKASTPVRVCKKYGSVLYYGTATLSDEDSAYPYNVRYDDGDFETMTKSEYDEAVKLFNLQPASLTKQHDVDEIGIEVLQGRNKIRKILKHKTITQNGVVYACLKVQLKNKSQWVQAGSILALSGKENMEHNWTLVHDYVSNLKLDHKFVFKYFSVSVPSKRTKNRDKKYKVFGAIYDTADETVMCIYPDGTYREIATVKLVAAVIKTAEVADRNSYIPTDYPEVLKMNDPSWLQSVENCMDSFINIAKTGRWVKRSSVKVKIISSRFVFQIKYRPDTKTYEAFCRITPRGYEEREGVHYDPEKIFAGTPQLCVLRFILSKALAKGQSTFHFDFKRAFPSTPLDRVIYVSPPRGYTHYDEDGDECVLALDKSAEGLKQSGANWLELLTDFMLKYGFKQSDTEPKLFKFNGVIDGTQHDCDVMVYIDDLFGTCSDSKFIDILLKDFNEKFKITCKNLGPISEALGIDVVCGDACITMCQERKIKDLLVKHDMQDCRERVVPLPCVFNIEEALDSTKLGKADTKLYQSLVGSYLWINRGTRPDITEATWLLARGMTSPTEMLLSAAFHLLRYLKGTVSRKLVFSFEKHSSLDLSKYEYDSSVPTGFCDSNWGVPRSQSCGIVMYMNAALVWYTKKQDSTALSTVEGELTALSDEAREMKYTANVFDFMGMEFNGPLPIFCDSKGAIENAKHPTTKNKLKHVDIKCFFIRECIQRKIVQVFKILGTENPADIGTKLLGQKLLKSYADFLSNVKP